MRRLTCCQADRYGVTQLRPKPTRSSRPSGRSGATSGRGTGRLGAETSRRSKKPVPDRGCSTPEQDVHPDVWSSTTPGRSAMVTGSRGRPVPGSRHTPNVACAGPRSAAYVAEFRHVAPRGGGLVPVLEPAGSEQLRQRCRRSCGRTLRDPRQGSALCLSVDVEPLHQDTFIGRSRTLRKTDQGRTKTTRNR
jgi:hypothetical protein